MKLDLSEIFNRAIEKIRKNIVSGVLSSKQLNGNNYTPNRPATAKAKGFNKRLASKDGTFTNSNNYKVGKATKGKQEATLTFRDNKMAEIGKYNQTPTGRGTIAKKDAAVFWGISEEMEKEVIKDVEKYINDRVDKEVISWGYKKV